MFRVKNNNFRKVHSKLCTTSVTEQVKLLKYDNNNRCLKSKLNKNLKF